jgi:hypothetical protein
MFHLVYASSAARPFTTLELQAFLEQARQKNARFGVTGMLLYKDGNFMQALEGDHGVVAKIASTKLAISLERAMRWPRSSYWCAARLALHCECDSGVSVGRPAQPSGSCRPPS